MRGDIGSGQRRTAGTEQFHSQARELLPGVVLVTSRGHEQNMHHPQRPAQTPPAERSAHRQTPEKNPEKKGQPNPEKMRPAAGALPANRSIQIVMKRKAPSTAR